MPSPAPGFYARVMERIEAQGAVSIWNAFSDSPFGRRIAVASMALALLLGVYLVTSEPMPEPFDRQPTGRFNSGLPEKISPAWRSRRTALPDRDAVLVNLVTYREQ